MKTKIVLMLVVATAMFAGGNVAQGDIVTRSIQVENDDAEEYLNTVGTGSYAQGAGWIESSDLELGSNDEGDPAGLMWQVIAMQYDQLGIPQGATITSAKITFQVDNSGRTGTGWSNDFTIFAEDADNASVFTGYDIGGWTALDSFNITSRARTTASVPWAPAAAPVVGTTLDTPDITALIQEVVNRAGWSENNRLTLMVYPDVYLALPDPTTGGSTSVQEIEFEAGPGSDSATLTVEFIADSTAPTVDAGDDMITWSGKTVELDPNVVNNDVTDLIYAWSAEPNDYVVFDPPDANVEDPNVTITKPALTLTTVTIANPGFEDPVLGDGGWESDPPAWTDGYYDVTAPGVWVVGDSDAGVYNPTAADGYGGIAAEGDNLMAATSGVGYDRGMNQVLSATTLQANTQYDLSALVGNPFLFNGSTTTADYRIELLAGGVVLALDTGPSPADDITWTTASCTHTSGADAVADPNVGQPLEIRLLAVDFTNGYGVDFDDVKLTAEGPTPDPYTVTLTLAVNNEGSGRDDVTDTMTIDVYDDACEAARIGKGLAADNPGDFDGNCITDFNDLDELATKWLNDTGLTGSVAKP